MTLQNTKSETPSKRDIGPKFHFPEATFHRPLLHGYLDHISPTELIKAMQSRKWEMRGSTISHHSAQKCDTKSVFFQDSVYTLNAGSLTISSYRR